MSASFTSAGPLPRTRPGPTRGAAYEALAIMLITIVPSLVWPQLKGVLTFLPIAYLLVERRVRHRTWGDIGLDPRTTGRALRATWPLVLLVAIGMQALPVLAARAAWPELLAHILDRVPLLGQVQAGQFVFLLLLATLAEELTYRALFQDRLSWLVGAAPAVWLVAGLFGLMHIAPGNPAIVAVDVIGVIVDGALYGFIFARGHNVYAAWLAHFAADVAGLALISLLV
jgi:membrane protease YdiL (CAAX protease family)